MNLIIGRNKIHENEIFLTGDLPKNELEKLFHLSIKDRTKNIVTFSPVIVEKFIYYVNDKYIMNNIFIFNGKEDIRLTDKFRIEYLSNFALYDLYIMGEFDDL